MAWVCVENISESYFSISMQGLYAGVRGMQKFQKSTSKICSKHAFFQKCKHYCVEKNIESVVFKKRGFQFSFLQYFIGYSETLM